MAETTTGTTRWQSLEQWTAVIFLFSGCLLFIGTVVIGLQLLTGDPTFLKNPFELAPYLGFIVSYFGLLGLYPRLTDQIPLARLSLFLLLVPVVVMVVYIVSAVLETDLPFAGTVSLVAFILFALGIAIFGIGSYQTEKPSRGVDLSLLAVAAAWFVLLGAGLINGFPVPQSVVFGTAATMTVSFFTIGYLLRTEPTPGNRTEPAQRRCAMTETTRATAQWGALEEWSSTAFLVGGILWLIDTGLLGLELFTGISILGTPGMVNPLLYLSGLVAAIVGLLGFYPALASRMPRLARVSAGLVSIAGIAILVLLMWFITDNFLNRPDPPVALLLLSLLVAVSGFVQFGFASIRTSVPSRTVGLLVLAIPAILFVLIVGTAVSGGGAPDWASPAIGGVMSILLLAIGYQLRSESATPDREKAESAPREVPP